PSADRVVKREVPWIRRAPGQGFPSSEGAQPHPADATADPRPMSKRISGMTIATSSRVPAPSPDLRPLRGQSRDAARPAGARLRVETNDDGRRLLAPRRE